eukprot:m.137908 g.137908  ORF g.137908 m.137908 type:complete len:61 (+) comp12625_c0_seq1:64-246(+)
MIPHNERSVHSRLCLLHHIIRFQCIGDEEVVPSRHGVGTTSTFSPKAIINNKPKNSSYKN